MFYRRANCVALEVWLGGDSIIQSNNLIIILPRSCLHPHPYLQKSQLCGTGGLTWMRRQIVRRHWRESGLVGRHLASGGNEVEPDWNDLGAIWGLREYLGKCLKIGGIFNRPSWFKPWIWRNRVGTKGRGGGTLQFLMPDMLVKLYRYWGGDTLLT